MNLARLPVVILLTLSACSQLPLSSAAPICDGRQRRPANPYGSVLIPTPGSAPAPAIPSDAETPTAAPSGFASCP